MSTTAPPTATKDRPASDDVSDAGPPRSAPDELVSREPGRPGRSDRPARVLAALGLLGTVVFGVAWLSSRNGATEATTSSRTSREVRAAAVAFSKDLTNFDGATIDRDVDRLTARSTGEFLRQSDQFFSTKVRTQLKAAQASSRGEVRSAFVQSMRGDRGTVFVVVDQTIANNRSPQPQADTLRMELGLVRVGDAWKVERVAVLTAPSGTGSPEATTVTTGGG